MRLWIAGLFILFSAGTWAQTTTAPASRSPHRSSQELSLPAPGIAAPIASDAGTSKTPRSSSLTPPNVPPIAVESRVETAQVPLNRTVRFIVRLSWAGARGQVEVIDVEQPSCTGLKVVSSRQENRMESTGGEQVAIQEITFVLQPEELGMATIKPLGVKFRFTATGSEQTLFTTRQTVEVVAPVRESSPRSWLLAGVLIGLGVLLLVAIGIAAVHLRRAAQAPEEETPEPTPAERALAALEEAKNLRIAGRIKDYHALIAATARQYLADCYGLPAREQPTEQLLSHLEAAGQPDLTAARLALVREILEACDLVKFAGATPDGAAMERVWQQARELVAREPEKQDHESAKNPKDAKKRN